MSRVVAPLRPRAVLRASLRLLRLRDGDGARGQARGLRRRRCSPSLIASARLLAPPLETVFVGGGTPTLLGPALLDRLLDGLPPRRRDHGRGEPRDGRRRARRGAGAPRRARLARRAELRRRELAVLERRATPETVRGGGRDAARGRRREPQPRRALRDPGRDARRARRDIDAALALEPDHFSCYELEAKPGTRFTFTHGAELARQAELLEDHYEHVIERLEGAGYRWYETRELLPRRSPLPRTTWRSGAGERLPRHRRRRRLDARARCAAATARASRRYIEAIAPAATRRSGVEEQLSADERLHERIMLGLRLDEPMASNAGAVDGRRPAEARAARRARAWSWRAAVD